MTDKDISNIRKTINSYYAEFSDFRKKQDKTTEDVMKTIDLHIRIKTEEGFYSRYNEIYDELYRIDERLDKIEKRLNIKKENDE